MRSLPVGLLLLILLVPPALHTQEVSVAAGRRVRVVSPAFHGVAYVREIGRDTMALLVENQGEPVRVPLATLQLLEVRRQHTTREGAWKGVK